MASESSASGPLFTFAVFGDTHVNPHDRRSPSPWKTNLLANRRAAAVVAQINKLRPDFVVHLGDMVHPVPTGEGYAEAAQRFHQIAAALQAPLHLVPGNHDVGDKPTKWTPAAHVSTDALAVYRKFFGPDYYSFSHKGCRFVVANSEIFNSGLIDEDAQWTWLDKEIRLGERTFVFTHYPPFLQASDEIEHYDNFAEPARRRFVSLTADKVEALFCGHVHNFFYNRIRTMDFYVVPATSAVRHDYTAVFSVPPDPESDHGRDTRSKLGFFLVEVFEDHHVAHFVHSWGEVDPEQASRGTVYPATNVVGTKSAPFGVDLRCGWSDIVSVPYAGAVDEFNRKRVRNDYIVLALRELGMRRLRIPLNDLVFEHYAQRVCELGAVGHRFTVFSFGMPGKRETEAIAARSDVIEAIEIVGRTADLTQLTQDAVRLREETGVPVFLSKLRISADAEAGHRFAHFIRHGFRIGESDLEAALAVVQDSKLDGLAFTIPLSGSAAEEIRAVSAQVSEKGAGAIVHVQLAGDDPAGAASDETATLARVAETAFAAWAAGEKLLLFLDTFNDHDRGYFPRTGLVDQRFDLRPAGKLLQVLIGLRNDWTSRHSRRAGFDMPHVVRNSAGGPGVIFMSSGDLMCEHLVQTVLSCRALRVDTGAAVEISLNDINGSIRVSCADVPERTPLMFLPERPGFR